MPFTRMAIPLRSIATGEGHVSDMKKLITIAFSLLYFFAAISFAEEANPCISICKKVSADIESIEPNTIKTFLETFSDTNCKNNVEYSEWSNELIFTLIENHPDQFFQTLFNLSENKKKPIIEHINSPILDINWRKIVDAVTESELPMHIQKKALELIKHSYKFDTDPQKVRVAEFE